MRATRIVLAASVVLGLAAAACSSDGASSPSSPSSTGVTSPVTGPETSPETAAPTTEVPSTVSLPPAAFTVRPGIDQVAVLEANPGDELELVAEDGTVAGAGTVDAQGSLLWRQLTPGETFVVRTTGAAATVSAPATVLAETDVPPASFYTDQQLPAGGFGYLTTRDGTTLSVNVLLPGPADKGPYPTIVEYSGYQPSDPGSSTFGQLFNALGYAYAGVNMRGTGCSGGSFLFFEHAQLVDGFDAIEAIAAQPWVQDHKVGMGGISYPGISQLFVASTRPPSLAAIAPLSVLDDSYRATGEPGGIFNTGFAALFLGERQAATEIYGQEWTKERADAGDTVCADNQNLRLQNTDFLALAKDQNFYDPAEADPLAPITFVDKIEVPVFLAGAWQDEQTGGHFANMLDRFTGSPHLYADLTNGLHTESLTPTILARMVEFLDLYVAHRTPSLAGARAVANILVPLAYGVSDVTLPDDRFTGMSYADALAAFEAEPPIRVHFEAGAGGAVPGSPYPRFTASFNAWPVPEAVATTWYLGDRGLLATKPQATGTPDSYTSDPTALPKAFYPGGRSSDIWKAGTQYDWRPIPSGTGVGYLTDALKQDTVMIGTGSVDLWVQSSAADTDFEVTLSEVRPDGTEMYIQSGWLRASHRALDDARSTDVLPVQTHAEADAEPLPEGEFTPVRIELFPSAYVFRTDSRIRITIDAPGNSRPVWEFDTISAGETNTIAHDSEHPSRLVLQIVPGLAVPQDLVPCGAMRGEPCRTYVPADNEPVPI